MNGKNVGGDERQWETGWHVVGNALLRVRGLGFMVGGSEFRAQALKFKI